jgi:HSP20 family molecular chaperone IbpA
MYKRFRKPSIWQEMDQLQREMNRLFDASSRESVFTPPSYPALNIWTNDDGQLISAEMPGVDPENITIDVTGELRVIQPNDPASLHGGYKQGGSHLQKWRPADQPAAC